MMNRRLSILITLAACSAVAFAAGPVATADSSEAFVLAGKTVPKAGIGNWPVFAGQTVQTLNNSVLLSMKDGTRVLLQKQSEATLLMVNDKLSLRLTRGAASYQLARPGSLAFDVVDKGIKNVIPQSGLVTAQVGLTADTVGYFALANRAAAPGSMPIVLNFTSVPSGVSVVPGPPPESSYRGAP
ncbi:MAG: hypothetical protein NTY38_20100 [Acidobacteria bacterium]|nr:hypothetical protein [Acidobacteriota bacterium]